MNESAVEQYRPTAKCRRCGRRLTDQKALAEGIGATCLAKEVYEMTHEMHPDVPVPKRRASRSKAAKLVRYAFGLGVAR